MPKVRRNSRLRFADFETLDGFEYWGVVDYPTIPEQPDDLLYRVQTSDQIQLLAKRFYGDRILYWVIAVANDLDITPTQLIPGSTIRIPSPRYVETQLFGKANF